MNFLLLPRKLAVPAVVGFLIFLWSSTLLENPWIDTPTVHAQDHEVLAVRARQLADVFVNRFPATPHPYPQTMRFSYEVHMELEAYVRTSMDVTIQMERHGDRYVSLFNLTEPQGKDTWSRFALFIYGRHTEDYQVLKTRVDTTIEETFIEGSDGFTTQELREVLSEEKDYENQTGIRILFDYEQNLILFWKDQTQKEPTRSIPYEGQTGPLAAFFNFVLIRDPYTTFTIINALKRTEEMKVSEGTETVRKKITFLFANEHVRLRPNETGKHTDFSNAVYFESANYLDIIYGQNIYYDIVSKKASNVKLPYSVLLEGLISKSKQSERDRRLQELMDAPMGHDALQERLREVEKMNVLAARNVRVYLKKAEVAWQ